MNDPQPPMHPGWKIWSNPIFRRYCRSRLRPRGLGVALLISVLISGFLFFLFRELAIEHTTMIQSDRERSPLIALLIFQGFILFILGTAQVTGGMTAETDEGVIDYQRLIPMSPLAKVTGYLFGLPVREYAMMFATLPFTAWALWKGEVAASVWVPLYAVFFTSTITYHLTGLVAGSVIKNRRWAFLSSIGLVLCLYTVIPQLARFGLVFFKYLTITPVLVENLPFLLSRTAGAIVATGQKLVPEVKFFNLDFSETVFTFFTQSGLVLTFVIMLCRRWRRTESLLLGKLWAAGVFIWVQVLLLGNALPAIDPGTIFPSRELYRRILVMDWAPTAIEAVLMSGVYGLVTMLLLFILTIIITPSFDIQIRGWRRVRKHGGKSLPLLSDSATAFGFVLVMALAGAAGWFVFTRAVVESRWFPGHMVELRVLGWFTAIMVSAGLAFHALLEAKGPKVMGLVIILVGVAPLMFGAVLAVSSLIPAASWLIGMSPASAPLYAVGTLLDLSELPEAMARPVPLAFYFWQAVWWLAAIWFVAGLRASRKAIAASAVAGEPGGAVEETKD